MQPLEIRLPRQVPKPIKSDVPIGLRVGAPTFHQTFQYPAQGEFETRLKREQATKFIGRSPFAEPFSEVHFAPAIIARGKTDRESLLRFKRHKKLNRPYAGKLTIFAPLNQGCEHFVENHYSGYKRSIWKMPG